MPPPQLARDAPGFDVFQPVVIGLFARLRHDFHVAIAHGVQRGADNLFRVHEPLVGQHRFDDHFGPVAEGLHDLLGLDQRHQCGRVVILGQFAAQNRVVRAGHDGQPLGGDFGNHLFAGVKPVQTAQVIGNKVDGICLGLGQGPFALGHGHGGARALLVGRTIGPHRAFDVHQTIHRDAAALGDLIVVEVMRAGDLDRAGPEILVRVFIGDDRDQPAVFLGTNRDFAQLPDDGGITFIRRVDRNRAVAQHGFGPGRGD